MFTRRDRKFFEARLASIESMLRMIFKTVVTIGEAGMASVEALTESVRKQTTVIEGVTALLDDLAADLAEAGTDPAKLEELRVKIESNTESLSAAVARNTDADDEVHAAGM
jgi:hypothetical protein